MELYQDFIDDLPMFPIRRMSLEEASKEQPVLTLNISPYGDFKFGVSENNHNIFYLDNFIAVICNEIPDSLKFKHLKEGIFPLFQYFVRYKNPPREPKINFDIINGEVVIVSKEKATEVPENIEIASYGTGHIGIRFARQVDHEIFIPGQIFPYTTLGEIESHNLEFLDYKDAGYFYKNLRLTEHGLENVLKFMEKKEIKPKHEYAGHKEYEFVIEDKKFTFILSGTFGLLRYTVSLPQEFITVQVDLEDLLDTYHQNYDHLSLKENSIALMTNQRFAPVFKSKEEAFEMTKYFVEDTIDYSRKLSNFVFERTFFSGVKKEHLRFALGGDDLMHIKPKAIDLQREYRIDDLIEEDLNGTV